MGGIEYITEVIDSVATAANVDYYINIVREKATLRIEYQCHYLQQ